jgi:rubrerythrin
MVRVVKWTEADGEEMLWVCQSCDAHLNADCVGNACPVCGVSVDEDDVNKGGWP